MAGHKNHDYHILPPSIWPLTGAVGAIVMLVGAVLWFHGSGPWLALIGLVIVLYTMWSWWADVIAEGEVGDHTPIVQIGLRYGMVLFIISEIMFFSAWFWTFFKHALYPMPAIEGVTVTPGVWPPAGIETFDPWHLPLINTLILLCSGCAATWAHHALVEENDRAAAEVRACGWRSASALLFTDVPGLRVHATRPSASPATSTARPSSWRPGSTASTSSSARSSSRSAWRASMPATSRRPSTSASRRRPGTGTSSTWSGCSCSRRSTSGAGEVNRQLPSVRAPATYQDVLDAPEGMVAELVGGTLHLQPRPASRHARASFKLSARLDDPFDRGEGGPGGWYFAFEPELHLGDDVLVPDLAGWRRERMAEFPDAPAIELAPDWVCEILSPGHRVDST